MKRKNRGFTLSEVIITLVVIGIVAAITVPMLSNSAHDKKWNVARQKAKATIGEAFRLMTVNGEITTKNADGTDRTTEYMVTKVLPKYLKLEKTCAPANYSQCGFPATVKTPSGGNVTGLAPSGYKWTALSPAKIKSGNGQVAYSYTAYNTNYFFRTLDGFSVAFLYNPYCVNDSKERFINTKTVMTMDTVCFMGIYDMNSKAGPNQVGKDIGFIGTFYNGFEVKSSAMLPHSKEVFYSSTGQSGSTSWERLYKYCDNIDKDKNWIMPDIYELSLMFLNYKLISNSTNVGRWFESRSPADSSRVWHISFFSSDGGQKEMTGKNNPNATICPWVRCVRANALK